MCIICVHYEKEKMTIKEASRALKEMRVAMDPEHVEEVEKMLYEDALASQEEEAWEYYWKHFDYVNTDYFGSD